MNSKDRQDTGEIDVGTRSGLRRRDVLTGAGTLAAGFAASSFLGFSSRSAMAASAAKPHIIYIVADDLGWKDVGFQGSDIPTPNLDKLALEGARFNQFYAQPMCTQTRAALMTGRYPLRYGLQTGVVPAAGTYSLPLDEYLLPQMLKDAGYTTAMSGKWHLGHAKTEFWPRQRGFDSFYGATVGEIDHFKHASHGIKDWYRDNKPLVESGFDNGLIGQEAVRLIKDHNVSKPLFLYLAFTAPHTPFQAPEENLDRFKHIEDKNRQTYAAMISVIDDEVGKVVAALDQRGMRNNTLIVFHSDNGGVVDSLFTGDSKVGGKLPADNGPYRAGKGTLYEGGTRVVAFMNFPKKIKAGRVDGMMHIVDVYPTLASLSGATLDKSKPLDGLDMWPTISEGKASPRTELVYNVDPMAGAIRRANWKLYWKASLPQRIELFDLSRDVSEANNLSDQVPEKVTELQGRIDELAKEMVPPLLLMEAVKLTFYSPLVTPDSSVLFNAGD